MAVGEPFLFCGRIVEAYYSNPELDTVAILWSDGDKNREYYVNVDEEDDQFNALLKEWSYESLDECTRNRNEQTRQEFRNAFHEYATENNLYGHGDDGTREFPEGRFPEERLDRLDLIFEYDPDLVWPNHKEQLFKLKLKIFEQEDVKKSKSKTKKAAVRKAETPLEAIKAYAAFVK